MDECIPPDSVVRNQMHRSVGCVSPRMQRRPTPMLLAVVVLTAVVAASRVSASTSTGDHVDSVSAMCPLDGADEEMHSQHHVGRAAQQRQERCRLGADSHRVRESVRMRHGVTNACMCAYLHVDNVAASKDDGIDFVCCVRGDANLVVW